MQKLKNMKTEIENKISKLKEELGVLERERKFEEQESNMRFAQSLVGKVFRDKKELHNFVYVRDVTFDTDGEVYLKCLEIAPELFHRSTVLRRFKIWSNYRTFDHHFDRFHEEVSKEEFNQIWEQVSKSLEEILEELK